MPRYIDADEIYRRVKEKTNPYGKPTLDYESGCKVLDMIEQAPTADVVPKEEADEWYHEYHVIKDELKTEKMYHRETEKLADKYFAECKHLQEMLEAATAGQETLQKETSKWVKECEELQERLIEYEKDLARQIFGKIEKIIDEKYSFFVHKSEYDEEVEAIINFSDSISNDIDDLKEKYIGDGEGEDHE